MRSLKSTPYTASTVEVVTSESASAPAAMQRSPWHSPVPYLFGGLAAMLGLIAFALLILACSYWKLSGQMSNEDGDDLESGDDEMKKGDGKGKGRVVDEEQFVVILAGDDKPTCLATPVTGKVRCFVTESDGGDKGEKAESGKGELEAAEKSDEDQSNTSSEQSHEGGDGVHLHESETSS